MLRRLTSLLLVGILCLAPAWAQQPTAINWHTNVREGTKQALLERKQLMLYFYAPDHAACQQVEAQSLNNAAVQTAISTNYIPVKINVREVPATARFYQASDESQLPRVLILGTGDQVLARFTASSQPAELTKQLQQTVQTPPTNSLLTQASTAAQTVNSLLKPAAPTAPAAPAASAIAASPAVAAAATPRPEPVTTPTTPTSNTANNSSLTSLLPKGDLIRDQAVQAMPIATAPGPVTVANTAPTVPTTSPLAMPDLRGLTAQVQQQATAQVTATGQQFQQAAQQQLANTQQAVNGVAQQATQVAGQVQNQSQQIVGNAQQLMQNAVNNSVASAKDASSQFLDGSLSPRPSQNPGLNMPTLPGMVLPETANVPNNTGPAMPSAALAAPANVAAAATAVTAPIAAASNNITGSAFAMPNMPALTSAQPVAAPITTPTATPAVAPAVAANPAPGLPGGSFIPPGPQAMNQAKPKAEAGIAAYSTENYEKYLGQAVTLPAAKPATTATVTTNTPSSNVPASATTPSSTMPSGAMLPGPTSGPATLNPPRNSQEAQAGIQHIGIDGHCPVTLRDKKAWVRGDVKYGAIHRGKTYLFASLEDQQKFLLNPDKYSPVLSGHDPVYLFNQGQYVQGTRQYGREYNGRLYLFTNPQSLAEFAKQPAKYENAVFVAENVQGRITR